MHRVLAEKGAALMAPLPAQSGSAGLMPGGVLMHLQMRKPNSQAVAEVWMHPDEKGSTASFISSVTLVVPAADSSLLQSADVAALKQWKCTLWEGPVWRYRSLHRRLRSCFGD